MQRLFILTIVSFFISTSNIHASEITIRLPITSKVEDRDQYQLGLLKLALSKVKRPYSLEYEKNEWTQKRIVAELKKGKIDLYWMGTSKQYEDALIPIRIPIYRGLLGYRVFIINKKNRHLFNQVTSIDALKKLTAAQGRGWTDIAILESAGLSIRANAYENIFKMVNAGRVDYFPRGVSEAFGEVASRIDTLPNLAIEENLLLVYPFAKFFFTSPDNSELAAIVEKGLLAAYQDGSFMNYFNNHPKVKSVFQHAAIEDRLPITINNPSLSDKTASIPSQYWHRLK